MIDNLMLHTCNVSRPTITQDSLGEQVNTLQPLFTNLACFFQPLSDSAKLLFQQRNIKVSHQVFTNDMVTLIPGDVLTFRGRTFAFQGSMEGCELGVYKVFAVLEYL